MVSSEIMLSEMNSVGFGMRPKTNRKKEGGWEAFIFKLSIVEKES